MMGICMLDDNKIHIQYSDGVSIDLDNKMFTDDRIAVLHDYIASLTTFHEEGQSSSFSPS
jgi:hypothetical protein